jgi:predicted ferric reductase
MKSKSPVKKFEEFKNIYINSLSAKAQKIANFSLNRNDSKKLNFTSFLAKNRQSRSKDAQEALFKSEKQTSPSV